MSIFRATDTPVSHSSNVSSGFQSQGGQPYLHFGGGVHDICSLRFTSGATPLQVYIASIAASRLPHMAVRRANHFSF